MPQRLIVGIGWYEKSQWPEYRRIMVDDVDENHADWLRQAEATERKLRKAGAEPVRVAIDLGDFELWCRTKGRACDASARAEYVAEKTRSL